MPKILRKLVAIRIQPAHMHQARIAAVTQSKTLGQWMEEAIQEKIGCDGNPNQGSSRKEKGE